VRDPLEGSTWALIRILGHTAGRAAVRRGLPTYFALLIAAPVLFLGKYAMKASELTGVARHSLAFRAVLLGGWLVLSLPVARALLASPSARFVRVFPVSWRAAAAILGAELLIVEGPWIMFWCAGEGALVGAASAVFAASGHALMLGRPRRGYELAALLAWLGGFILGPGLPWFLGPPALVLGLRRAWISGAEPRVRHTARWVLRAPPAVALATGLLASVVRGHRALLGRWAWLAVGTVAIAVLAIHNNGVVEPGKVVVLSLLILAPGTTLGALTLAGAMLRTEHRAAWVLDTTGTGSRTRQAAASLALAACGVVFGLGHGLLVSQVRGQASVVRVLASSAVAGAALGALAAIAARWTDLGGGRDSRRVLLAAFLVAGGVMGSVFLLAEIGLLLALVAAAAGVTLTQPPLRGRTLRVRLAEDQD
jgi:hypothetical protein